MVITATFATWFGSETVLGLPGQFIKNGLEGVVEEPFGSSMALILVGMFFARKLYRRSVAFTDAVTEFRLNSAVPSLSYSLISAGLPLKSQHLDSLFIF